MYYRLYTNNSEIPSKVAFNPEEPSLGRIRADYVVPPHSPASIKRCISRVEKTSALAHAFLLKDITSDTPLKDDPISIHGADGPGLSPNEPIAIVQVESPIPDGRYAIRNRARDICWNSAGRDPLNEVLFYWGGPVEQGSPPKNISISHLQVRSILQLLKVFE